MATVRQPPILTTDEWGALRPRGTIIRCEATKECIFHHTAGHHPEVKNPRDESVHEAVLYARGIQAFHMFGNHWIDSGHNYLVCRNGILLVGRHQSFTQNKVGRMVVSAHCVGHNQSVGVEWEHEGSEPLTPIQLHMGSWLYAWIHAELKIPHVTIYPHRKFNKTSCPGTALEFLPAIKRNVTAILRGKVNV